MRVLATVRKRPGRNMRVLKKTGPGDSEKLAIVRMSQPRYMSKPTHRDVYKYISDGGDIRRTDNRRVNIVNDARTIPRSALTLTDAVKERVKLIRTPRFVKLPRSRFRPNRIPSRFDSIDVHNAVPVPVRVTANRDLQPDLNPDQQINAGEQRVSNSLPVAATTCRRMCRFIESKSGICRCPLCHAERTEF